MAGMYDDTPTSRFEEVMRAIIDGTEYTHEPRSVEEALLIELNDLIKAGGGGGTKDYNALSNKPKVNDVTLQGDLSITSVMSFGDGLSYNSSTKTLTVSQQSVEDYIEDALPENMADDSDIDDLFNN